MVSKLKTEWFHYRELRIRYAHRSGKPGELPLLMFNGIGQSVEALQPLIDSLGDIPIVTLDVPGIGLSDVPNLPWRYRQHARLAAELLNHLGYDQANVFGVSWGSGLAQEFSRRYPRIAQKLILAATIPGVIMIPGNPRVYSLMASPRRFTNKHYMDSIAGKIYGGDLRIDQSAAQKLLALQKHPPTRKGYLFQATAMYGWTNWHFLRRLSQPTLILHGEDDPMIPQINAHMMARLIRNSHLEIIDCGHLFVLTRINRIAPMILKFAYH